MRSQSGLSGAFGRHLVSVAGTLCVAASLALHWPGVRVARAEDRPAPPVASPSIAPAPAAAPVAELARETKAPALPGSAPAVTDADPPKSSPFVKAEDVEQARRPGVSGIETSPGVIVLNTRGYNYGPPPTPLEPEALEQEQGAR